MATRNKPGQTLNVEDVFPGHDPTNTATQLRTVTVADPAPDPIEYDDVTALNNVLAELGADETGGFVVVHRENVQPSGKREDEYLDRFPVGEFSLDGLKSRWGAGKYKINVYHSGGAGLAARKTITIAKDPTATISPSPQAAVAPLDLTPIITAINQGSEKTLQAILALAQSSQQKQSSRMEMLQEMAMMREIMGGHSAPPAPTVGILEALKLGAEMAGGGGGDSNNAWVGKIIDQLGPVLMPAVAGAVQNATSPRPTPAAARTPGLTAPPTATLPAPAPAQQTEEENPVNIIIVQYLNMLKRAAEQKAPVDEYADSILASIPQSQVVEVENILRPDDWRDKLRAMTNAADTYPEWFGSLRDTLLQYIDEDKAQVAGVTTHLTTGNEAGSVSDHVNDNSGISENDTGGAGGAA